jgi:carbon storage regulator
VLVLTRRVGDSIVIGHEVVVTVLEVRSDQVRIGIEAPREVTVHREEVYRQMVEQNAQAVESAEGVERINALRRRLRGGPPRPVDRPAAREPEGAGAPEAAGGPDDPSEPGG